MENNMEERACGQLVFSSFIKEPELSARDTQYSEKYFSAVPLRPFMQISLSILVRERYWNLQ